MSAWSCSCRVEPVKCTLRGLTQLWHYPNVNLRKRFAMDAIEDGQHTRIIVLEINSIIIDFVVDSFSEVMRISRDTVEYPPAFLDGG